MVLDKEVEKALGIAALKIQNEVKLNSPVRTGRLRNSIVADKINGVWTIGTNLDYAEHVEIGVAPHVIKPKEKKALFWAGAEHPVKEVKHPGFEGRNMFLKASIKSKDIIRAELDKLK